MTISKKLIRGWRNQFWSKPLSKNLLRKLNATKKRSRLKIRIRPFISSLWRFAKVEKCEHYQDDCQEWSRKQRLGKTWSNFKAHFARAFKETQICSRNLKTEGYAANVKSAQANAELFTEMKQDHTMELIDLATATQADSTSVEILTKIIAELTKLIQWLKYELMSHLFIWAFLLKGKHPPI